VRLTQPLLGTAWHPWGPSPIQKNIKLNGLVTAISIHPYAPNILYMGTGSGGMWRSDNGGEIWLPLFDRQLTLGIGEPNGLALDPNNANIVYLGTSKRVSREPRSAGLFKSMDGGYSWIRLGSGYPLGNTGNASQFFNQNINVILVDPANSSTLYLGSDQGVYRSTDGGINWTQGKTTAGNVPGIAFSLVLDSSISPGILYAGISGIGVFRSNDGGLNWTQILSNATPGAQDPFGKVVVDLSPPVSPPNPGGAQIIYVAIRGVGGAKDQASIFISRDQGTTWSQQSDINLKVQGDYCFHVAVDPGSPGDGNSDIIYLGAVDQLRSDDSGVNFVDISNGLHPDTHAWAFVRQPNPTPSIVYCGNDGGLFKSTDRGTTWTPLNSGRLQTGLFYNIDATHNFPFFNAVGALQDNGIYTTASAIGREWKGGHGGDGWDVAFDQKGGPLYCTDGVYKDAPLTRMFRSSDQGLTFPTEITPWDTTTDAGMYLAVIATDPNTTGIVYVSGSQNLWQSFDSGNSGSWRIITPVDSSCDSIDVARGNGNHVVIAIDDKVFLSTNALAATVGGTSGVTFTNIKRNLPNRFVTRVAFDPNDPSIIYAVLGGFGTGHVFRTSISASSWTDISPNIDAPFSAIAFDADNSPGENFPSSMYVGTEFGVLRSVDGGSSWSVLDDIHFPRVPVLDLVIRNKILFAATFGRGVFAFADMQDQPIIAMNLEHNLAFGTVRQGPQFLTLQIFNIGLKGTTPLVGTELVIESVQRLMGSTSFSVLPTPSTPLRIPAGGHIDFSIEYNPSGAGVEETATIRIISNDPNAPFVDLSATGMQAAFD
jgi:photosystem II stability/assembly factor-like uncharacterized protein